MSGLLAAGPAALAANNPILKPPSALYLGGAVPCSSTTVAVIQAAFRSVNQAQPSGSLTTSSTSYVTAVSITGAGVLEYLAIFSALAGTGTADIRVTIDGVAVLTASTSAASEIRVVVGSAGTMTGTLTNDAALSCLSLGAVSFRSSLLIEHKVSNASNTSGIVAKHRLA